MNYNNIMNFNNIDTFTKQRDVSAKLRFIIQTTGKNFVEEDVPKRRRVFQETFEKYAGEPVQVQVARGFSEFLRQKSICLHEYDLLAGHIQPYDYTLTSPLDIPPELITPRGLLKDYIYDIHPEIEKFLEDNHVEKDSETYRLIAEFEKCWRNKLFIRYVTGHVIAGYERVVKYGFGGLLQEAEKYDNVQAQSSQIVLKGASEYILRYADKAEELAHTAASPENASHMRKIAQCCRNIATKPASSFFEGVQLIWLTHEMIITEIWPSSHSLGRLDKILQPLYDADVKKGAITYDEAQEYIYALWIKFASWSSIFQNVTLGGAAKDNPYLCGEVTRMCLNATKVLRYDQPQLSVRTNDHMPDDFFEEVIDVISRGGGFPSLFNDEIVIRAKTDAGIPLEDAMDYGIIGCVETSVGGKEYANTEALRFNYGKVMELFLSRGVHYETGDITPMKAPSHFESFEEFYDCFLREADRLLEFILKGTVMLEPVFGAHWPNPFLSATMEGPLQSGLDATAGGAVYPYSSANACGIANAANSLAAIKKLVFDEKRYTLEEIKRALSNNFEGAPGLHRELLHCPKFGNDIEEVDRFNADITRHFIEVVSAYRNYWGKPFQPGLYTVDGHVRLGSQTGALPDGRKAETALQNGFSPVQGTDINGATAVINSVCKSDFSKIGNGMVLDLKFVPSFFESSHHRQAFKALIKTYFKKGGLEIQFNVVDRQVLLDAQQHPEQYPDLIVRVSGYSAYFTSLLRETQNEIIRRTEHFMS